MGILILGLLGSTVLGILWYLVFCVHRFGLLQRLKARRPVLSWLIAIGCVSLLGLFALYNIPTLLIVVVHLALAFLLTNLIGRIAKRCKRPLSADLCGAAAIALTAVYLGIGCFFAFHIFETDYTLTTEKPLARDLRIVEIADSHLGITLNGARFTAEMQRIDALEPDLVVVVGDFVDDDSDRDDMLAACRALGSLKTTYGVYFVFGNHDTGYFSGRDFSTDDLMNALNENHVTVLRDESVLLDDSVYLIGRRDRSMPDRRSASELMADLDPSRYCIFLDHQPNDYENEAAAGADLVLSGHTHGGHIFPAGQIGLLIGANDALYGLSQRGGTTFLVTSGTSGWAIPIKTGTFSEFVVIDLSSTASEA